MFWATVDSLGRMVSSTTSGLTSLLLGVLLAWTPVVAGPVKKPAGPPAKPVAEDVVACELLREKGQLMLQLRNTSDRDVAVRIGKKKVALRPGKHEKIPVRPQQRLPFELYLRSDDGWQLRYATVVPGRPHTWKIPIKP